MGKLESLGALGIDPYPYSFERTHRGGQLERRYAGLAAGAETDDRVRVAGRIRAIRNSGMFIDLHDASGKIQIFCHKDLLGSGTLGNGAAARHRRSDRRRGPGPAHPARRADRQCDRGHGSGEGPAAAAREISRPRRYRAALSPALSRPDHEPGEPRDAAPAQPDRRGDAQPSLGARLSRSRDADAAHDPRRRLGKALRHPPQRARHRPLSADRARAAPEAAVGRRPRRQIVRNQPLLPQRGSVAAAQSGIHLARALRGLCRLHRDDAS